MNLRRQRFENVAARRVQKILQSIEVLGNCSNRNNYEYTEADTKKMFAAIKDKLRETESLFDNELGRSAKKIFRF